MNSGVSAQRSFMFNRLRGLGQDESDSGAALDPGFLDSSSGSDPSAVTTDSAWTLYQDGSSIYNNPDGTVDSYDSSGNLMMQQYPDGSFVLNDIGGTVNSYDSSGNLMLQQYSDGSFSLNTVGGSFDTYDSNGNLVSSLSPDGSWLLYDPASGTITKYDAAGNIVPFGADENVPPLTQPKPATKPGTGGSTTAGGMPTGGPLSKPPATPQQARQAVQTAQQALQHAQQFQSSPFQGSISTTTLLIAGAALLVGALIMRGKK